MSRQDSSDPLPYVQVDRAVEPASGLLAGHMGVTRQHALGSLIGFWKLCGDPRELERVVETTPKGEEPALVLEAEDVTLRFQLASDHRVEPIVLARLGILEQVDSSRFRVRGMSRFFDPIKARVTLRRSASAAGKASAEARKKTSGTAQPIGGKGSKGRSDDRSDDVRTEPNGQPNDNGTAVRMKTERHPNESERVSERIGTLEGRDQSTSLNTYGAQQPAPALAVVDPPKAVDPRLHPLKLRLVATFLELRGVAYAFGGQEDMVALKRLLPLGTDDEIDRRWRAALAFGSDWPGTSSIAQLSGSKRWNDLSLAKAPPRVSIEDQPSRML